MAVAPYASLECTAESNLARSLTSSRSRRARQNPQLQPHEEFKKLPETREGEHEGGGGSGRGRGGERGGGRGGGGRGGGKEGGKVVGRKESGGMEKKDGFMVGGEGLRARGMSIEQLEAEAGRTDLRPN
ncbi:unnamed protein product, partial [Closterium sp. NIES-54]